MRTEPKARILEAFSNFAETPSCAKTRPSRHRRKNCASRNQAKTLAREQVTRRPRTLDCGSTHRWIGCVSFIIILVGILSISGGTVRRSGLLVRLHRCRRVQKHKRTQDRRAETFRISGVSLLAFSRRCCTALAESKMHLLWLCLLFIHPRAPNLISLRSAGTMPA